MSLFIDSKRLLGISRVMDVTSLGSNLFSSSNITSHALGLRRNGEMRSDYFSLFFFTSDLAPVLLPDRQVCIYGRFSKLVAFYRE